MSGPIKRKTPVKRAPREPRPPSRPFSPFSLVVIGILIVLGVIGAFWALRTAKLQDCVMSGRRNCAPIDPNNP